MEYYSSSINCLIAYQYRSGINGDRLLTSTRVSTTRAWEQARSILRINCVNVSPTRSVHTFQLIIELGRSDGSYEVKIKNPLLWRGEEQTTNNTSNSWSGRKRWLGQNKRRRQARKEDRPCQWANSGNSAAIFLLGCQVSFNEEIK